MSSEDNMMLSSSAITVSVIVVIEVTKAHRQTQS